MPVHSATDVGRARDVNEDSVCHETFGTIQLLAVADGMGGHSAGDVASETGLNELTEAISDEVDAGQTDRQTMLETGITRANDAVRDARTGDPARGNMGTTLVAALIRGGDAVVGNVGDSRAYHVSAGEIEQISVDQSLVRNLIETGSITEAEARTHPQRHVLTQALGTEESVDPDFYRASIDGGTLLLCSDGLTEELPDKRIHEIVTSGESPEEICTSLIEDANMNGGSDNISVVSYQP